MLHGRDVSLGALREQLANAHAGRGQLVLLSGEAGIGKSALADAIAEEAQRDRAHVTFGRAWEFAEAPAYFPLWPCMRAVGMAARGDELADAPAFEVWEGVLSALARQAEKQTVVWIVEDVHAADLGTLDLLTYLARPLRAIRALIVATLRAHDPRLGERKAQRVARMSSDGVVVNLEPVPAAAIAAIAQDALGREWPADALERLAEVTGGNPLFIVECARASRTGGVHRTLEQVPPTLRQLIVERVGLLPEATRRALDAAAVLGREPSAATVARMMGTQPARVIDELVPALRAGVLREARTAHFTFSHVLVRDAIEDAIDADARARLHAAACDAMAELGDHAEVLVERARHALDAARIGDQERARELAGRAAAVLEREGAFDRAFELYARLDDARAAGFVPPASAEEKLHVARVARDAGRLDVMKRRCEEVIAAARSGADHELFARAVLLHATIVRPGVIDPFQVSLLEEARAALPARSPLGCRVTARLATALQPADDATAPNELGRLALADAHALGDRATIVEVLDLAALGMWGSPLAERIAWSTELRDLVVQDDDVPLALRAWSILALWYAEGGELDRYSDACQQVLALADRAPQARHKWDPLLLASGYACARGNFLESDGYVAEVAQIAGAIDDPALEVALVFHEIAREKMRRRPAELAVVLSRLDHVARELRRGALIATITRAASYARVLDVEATRAELSRLGAQARVMAAETHSLAYLAEAYALAGSDEDRRWAHGVISTLSLDGLLDAGMAYTYEGTTGRVLGLLDAALGDLESAERRLRRAYEQAKRHGFHAWTAQLAYELGTVVAKRGGAARALLDEATALGREHGIRFDQLEPARPTEIVRMARTADVWTVECGASIARVKDSRGMHLLARLIERQGEEIHALALASDEGASAPESNAGEMLDERARKAYKKRVGELEVAIAAARTRGDTKAAARHDEERKAIIRELARATGIGGRARMAGSETERARVNVQRRLKEAIGRIAEAAPELGALLDSAVRTGTFCCFRPPSAVPEPGTPKGQRNKESRS